MYSRFSTPRLPWTYCALWPEPEQVCHMRCYASYRVFIFRLQIDDGLIPDCVPAPRSPMMIICELVSNDRTLWPRASILCLGAQGQTRPQHNDNNLTARHSQLPAWSARDYSNEAHNEPGQGEIISTQMLCQTLNCFDFKHRTEVPDVMSS